MSLTPGSAVGPYQIVGVVGAGGMGEVYRARDSRLGRDVAIKVLPEAFATDLDRRERFEREAQAVAALSHPNVVAIFDTGVHEGHAFVVMELLDGQTLRERLAAGALPLRKAVDIAVQIARGLGAAHGKQIVHRDLKPENVFLLADGQVKILDFGLAKALDLDPSSGAAGATAARTMAATDPGTVMGTVGYMAPEQVRAQAVDARADLFAFGAVLYEMVSGQSAFRRDTAADTMSAILTQDPPELTGSRPDLSPALDRIIRHCLEKNPNERFQSARDVAFALEALSGSQTSSGASAALQEASPKRRAMSPLVIAALVLAAIAIGAVGRGLLVAPAPVGWRFTIKTFEDLAIFNARFMPDDETVVLSAAHEGNVPALFEIRAATLEARPFGPPGTHLLSVSSTGELAVLIDARYYGHRLFSGTLARMTLEGAPRPWLERVREADWSPDGSTMAIIRDTGTSDVLEYPIGTRLHEATGYLSDPRVSPDGARVAFMEHPNRWDDRGFVKVVDASGRVTTVAGEYWGEEGLAWLPGSEALLFAAIAPFGDDGGRVGESMQQVYRVAADGSREPTRELMTPDNVTIHDVSADGRRLATRDEIRQGVVARGAGQPEEHDLSWLDRNWNTSLSADGQRLLFADGNGGADYSVVWRTTDGSPVVRLGAGDARGFSPDGRWALAHVFSASQLVAYPIGAGEPARLDSSPLTAIEDASWFPDSRSVIIAGSEPGKARRVYRQTLAGGAPEPILPDEVTWAVFAPDGRTALGVTADGAWSAYPLDGGPAIPVQDIDPDAQVIGWSADSLSIFVRQGSEVPARVDRIEVATGRRTFFREFGPEDRTGLVAIVISGPVLKDDGSQYAYRYDRRLSRLFLATPDAR